MDQASEAIVEDLASAGQIDDLDNSNKNKNAAFDLTLTEEQEMLAVPSPLVYIAGLVLSGKSATPPFGSALQQRFFHLQDLYNAKIEGSDEANFRRLKTFLHLSPRIAPAKEQQRLVDREISRRLNKMEEQTNAIAQDLLDKEANPVAKRKNRNKKQKKTKNWNQALPKPSVLDKKTPTTNTKQTSETLQEAMALQIQHDVGSAVEEDLAWTVVRKGKGIQKPNDYITDEVDDREEKENHTAPMEIQIKEASSSSSSSSPTQPDEANLCISDSNSTADNSSASYLMALLVEPQPVQTVSGCTRSTPEDISFTAIIHHNISKHHNLDETYAWQERRIRQLEQQLAQEREFHSKRVREEKVGSDDLVQALQLRLYISETRLKTYQDALKQHVQAVDSNISNTFTPSSPIRRGPTESSYHPPSSPLISRVLSQQNRLET